MILKMITINEVVHINIKAIKSMTNPLRLKIIQEISLKGTATTKEIAESCPDIPQATLYRHLNTLLKHGIVEVVSENKIRGIHEKVYSIKQNPQTEINKKTDTMTKQELSELYTQFMISLLTDFNDYLDKSEVINVREDLVGFRSYSLYVTDEEFIEMMKEMRSIIEKRLINEPDNNRKLRKFSTITTPYKS